MMSKTDRYFLVTVAETDVFCAEVTLAKTDPEVIVGSPMIHIERDVADDPVELACEALKDVLTDDQEPVL